MLINVTMNMLGESFTISSCWGATVKTSGNSNYIDLNKDTTINVITQLIGDYINNYNNNK